MSDSTDNLPSFYTHAKRPQWGAAVVAWEQPDKRGYLFEDGTVRVIAQRFYPLMVPSQKSAAGLLDVFKAHLNRLKLSFAEDSSSKPDPKRTISLHDQLALFHQDYKGGFAGSSWRLLVRGQGAPRRLKRHRDPAIADARDVLTVNVVDDVLQRQSYSRWWDRLLSVLERTDLVSIREVKSLRARVPTDLRAMTLEVRELLVAATGESADATAAQLTSFARRLERVLGCPPSWPLATVFLALASPDQHICVRPVNLRRLAHWTSHTALRSSHPNGADYARVVEVVRDLRAQLEKLGAPPADLMDVYDLLRLTTIPSAEQRMLAMRPSMLSAPPAAIDGAQVTKGGADEIAA
jgi:hypothetical protein